MARYLVEEEARKGSPSGPRVTIEGLAVAKASARKRASESSLPVIVRSVDTGEIMARFEPASGNGGEPNKGPALANSVRRMRAANDRLKDALVPGNSGAHRKKRA